jgi:hypothetical protein
MTHKQIVIVVWCILFLFGVQRLEAQSLLGLDMQNDHKDSALERLTDFFEMEGRFPKKFAAYSSFKMVFFTEESIEEIVGYQIFAADSTQKVWRVLQVIDESSIDHVENEGFFDGNQMIERNDSSVVNSPFNPAKWSVQKTKEGSPAKRIGYFNP